MIFRNTLVIIFFLFQNIASAQSVWAGDVNNNGIVSKVDLIYLGYAFGETGANRPIQGEEWRAYDLPQLWESTFPNDINFLYADCNGDGIVNELDADVIIKNIGLTHDDVIFTPDEVLIGEEGQAPSCKFMNPPSVVPVDQLFSLEIGLGEENLPVENMSGFTFIIDVSPQIIRIDSTELTFNKDSWIDFNEDVSINYQQKNANSTRLKVAFTKTDRVPVSGSGNLGKVSFLIEGDIISLLEGVDSITLTTDSIIVLNGELEPIPIAPDTLKIAIEKGLSVGTLDYSKPSSITVYPNPSQGFLFIEPTDIKLEKVEFINNVGQIIFTKKLGNKLFESVNFQHLESGLYWAKFYSDKGVKTEIIHRL